MMNTIGIVLVLLQLFYCNGSLVCRHTPTFINHWNPNNSNKNKLFFDQDTFGINLYSRNPCTVIKSNNVFRNFVKKNVACNGKHCIDQEFTCLPRGTKNCYHVEHIIDIGGPEFEDQDCDNYDCKDIAANRVMAWGVWNSNIGGSNTRFHYMDTVKCEKEQVYGIDIVNKVRQQIQLCLDSKKKLFVMQNNTNDECYADEYCNCDSDSECGCDCDYDIVVTDIYVPDYVYVIMVTFAIVAISTFIGFIIVHKRYLKLLESNGYQQTNLINI